MTPLSAILVSTLASLAPRYAGAETCGVSALLGQANNAPNPLGGFFLPAVAMMALAYLLLIRPQQTKQRQYDQMLAGLKENDRVVTTGGIHGVVTNIQRDAERLTLRVDDATGAKLRVGLWAISHLESDDKPEKADGQGGRGKTESKNKK